MVTAEFKKKQNKMINSNNPTTTYNHTTWQHTLLLHNNWINKKQKIIKINEKLPRINDYVYSQHVKWVNFQSIAWNKIIITDMTRFTSHWWMPLLIEKSGSFLPTALILEKAQCRVSQGLNQKHLIMVSYAPRAFASYCCLLFRWDGV